MDENNYRFGVGVLVLASAIIGLLLVVFFGAVPQLWVSRYTVTINFADAPGVSVDTPVRKNGVQIGRVSRVTLLPDDGGVNLDLELENKYEIKQGEICRIGTGSFITGDGVVEFIRPSDSSLIERFDGLDGTPKNGLLEPAERAVAESLLKNGTYLKGGIVQADALKLLAELGGDFATTLAEIKRTSKSIDSLAVSFQGVVDGSSDNIQAVVEKTKQALDSFNRIGDSVQRLLGQIENSPVTDAFGQVVERLPAIVDEAERVVKQTNQTLKSFEDVGKNFQEVGTEFQQVGKTATSTLKNIEEFTSPLRSDGKRVMESAVQTFDNLSQLAVELRRFANRLNQGQGTVSRLIEDPELYYRLVGTIENIEQVTQRLVPVANDVRIFTDKVSRDPSELIDVKGLIGGRPRGVGLK